MPKNIKIFFCIFFQKMTCERDTTTLRTDPGTENGTMVAVQCYLRANSDDELSGKKAHRYGSSTSNQRVECCGLI